MLISGSKDFNGNSRLGKSYMKFKSEMLKKSFDDGENNRHEFDILMNRPDAGSNKVKRFLFELGSLSSDSVRIIYENFLRRYYDKVCEYDPARPSRLDSPVTTRMMTIVKDGTGSIKRDFRIICTKYLKTRRSLAIAVDENSTIKKDFSAGESLAQNIARTKLITEPFIKFYEDRNVFGRCQKNFINILSLNNRYEWVDRDLFFDKMLPYLHVLIVFVMVVSIVIYEYWHEDYCAILQSNSLSVGDYTLRFYNLPYGRKYMGYPLRENLKTVIRYGDHRNVVRNINFNYDINEYLSKKDELSKQIVIDYRSYLKTRLEEIEKLEKENELKGINSNNKRDNEPLLGKENTQAETASDKTKNLIREIQKFQERYDKDAIELMTGQAHVSFENIHIRDLFYKKFRKKGFCYENFRMFHYREVELSLPVNNGERMIYCKKPNEPNDIIWENLKYSRLSRFFRRLFADFISFFILFLGFFFLYYMKTHQVSTNQANPCLGYHEYGEGQVQKHQGAGPQQPYLLPHHRPYHLPHQCDHDGDYKTPRH